MDEREEETGRISWNSEYTGRKNLRPRTREPGRPYLFFHTLNDRHIGTLSFFLSLSIPLYVGGLQTIFVGDTLPPPPSCCPYASRFLASLPRILRRFVFSPFVVVVVVVVLIVVVRLLIFFVAPRTVTIRGEETNGYPSTSACLECREHTTGTDPTFIRHDRNGYLLCSRRRLRMFARKIYACALVLVISRTTETRCPSMLAICTSGKFDGAFARTSEIPTVRRCDNCASWSYYKFHLFRASDIFRK